MGRMTIRLFDTQAQAAYKKELESYAERVAEAQKPGARWPEDLKYPMAPEPMVSSRDKGLDALSRAPSLAAPSSYGGAGLVNSDLRPMDPADLDGTSQQTPKGFDTAWSCDEDASSKPFKLKKG